MTVVHNQPHPMAMKYVVPSNPNIAAKFGIVRIEDWHDRIRQETWIQLVQHGDQESTAYASRASVAGNVPPSTYPAMLDVVLCHTQTTGEVVLLHDDWLQGAQIIH
jgi:hypothetical protein